MLDLLRTHKHTFPQVDVQYDPDSSTTPVILHIRPHFDLLFSGTHQRLHTIAVRRLRDPNPPLTLRYKGNVLSSPDKDLRRVNVNLAFGPTYPGEDLRYPGVRFCFDDEGLRDKVKEHDDRSQEVVRLLITQTQPSSGDIDALSEVRVSPMMYGELAEAIAKVSQILYTTVTSHRMRLGTRWCRPSFLPHIFSSNPCSVRRDHRTRSTLRFRTPITHFL